MLAGMSEGASWSEALPPPMFPSLPQTGMEPRTSDAAEEQMPEFVIKEYVARTYNLLNPENLLQYQLDMEHIVIHQPTGLIKVFVRNVNTDVNRDPPRTIVHMEWVEFHPIT